MRRRAAALAALVAIPLVASAAALRADLPLDPGGRRHLGIALLVGAVCCAVGLVLLAMILRRRFESGERGDLLADLLAPVYVLVPILILVGSIFVAVVLLGEQPPVAPAPIPGTPTTAMSGQLPKVTPHPILRTFLLIVIGVAVVLVVGIIVVQLYRRRRRPAQVPIQPLPPRALDEVVHESLRRAAEAFATTDDVRVAITRCYVAMQHSLDDAGLPVSEVRTPSEVLAEAVRRGLVPHRPATVLTRLFERARFSSDALGSVERDEAQGALDALRGTAVSS